MINKITNQGKLLMGMITLTIYLKLCDRIMRSQFMPSIVTLEHALLKSGALS